jgi:arginase family enzyme
MEIAAYFEPLEYAEDKFSQDKFCIGSSVLIHKNGGAFPDLNGIDLAIIGLTENRGAINNSGCSEAAAPVRDKFYALKKWNYPYKIADLGNLKSGLELKDTYAALATVVSELIKDNILPVIIGGSQDLTYGQYLAYVNLQQTVNIAAVDCSFDLGRTEEKLNANTFLGKIILHEPNYLFNFSNIGYQSYFTGYESVELMKKLFFDVYRLGEVQANIEEVEPIVRNADILSFDISSVRQSDAPANANATPNGFYGEEVCRILRYAGISDKLSTVGFYEMNPILDSNGQTAHLVAQMLWYLIEGFYSRKKDYPWKSKADFLQYKIAVENSAHEIIFYKSTRSERWWMEVPFADSKIKYQRHHIVPCSYNDYQKASKQEVPERWWRAFQKLSA